MLLCLTIGSSVRFFSINLKNASLKVWFAEAVTKVPGVLPIVCSAVLFWQPSRKLQLTSEAVRLLDCGIMPKEIELAVAINAAGIISSVVIFISGEPCHNYVQIPSFGF